MSNAVKERPILFSGAMVRALLAGTKTQTRRGLKPGWAAIIDEVSGKSSNLDAREDEVTIAYLPDGPDGAAWYVWLTEYFDEGVFLLGQCPYGKPGDRLWVRETWRGIVGINPPHEPIELAVARYVPDQEHCRRVEFQATQRADNEPYRPSIHMPRWASRLLLEIVSVRVERVQAISEADAVAEGCRTDYWSVADWRYPQGLNPISADCQIIARSNYASLWQEINGPDSWAANPWVWVVEFKVISQEGGNGAC